MKSYKVLIVDDFEPIREVLRIRAERHGLVALVASSEAEAIKIIDENHDLIALITDFELSNSAQPDGGSGKVVAGHFAKKCPNGLRIGMSGDDPRRFGASVMMILNKPIEEDAFVDILETAKRYAQGLDGTNHQ